METLKYTIIKTKEQYYVYCNILESLVDTPHKNDYVEDEIDLITLLIEKYDEEHSTFTPVDPVTLLHSFMSDHQLTATKLADLLNVSKAYVFDILNYKKGLSNDVIRKLSEHFKVKQEAFNRPYPLQSVVGSKLINAK